MTAQEAAQKIASGALSAVELTKSVLARIDAVEPNVKAFLTVTPGTGLSAGRKCGQQADGGRSAWPACRRPDGPQRQPLHDGKLRRPQAVKSSTTSFRRTMQRLFSGFTTRGRSLSGRRTLTSSQWGQAPKTAAFTPPATPTTPTGYPAAVPAVRRRRSRRAKRWFRSAPTPAVPYDSPPPCAALWA